MMLIQVLSFFSKKKGNTTANSVQFITMATIITYPSALEYWLSEKGSPYHFHFDRYSSRVKNKVVLLSNTSGKDLLHSVKQALASSISLELKEIFYLRIYFLWHCTCRAVCFSGLDLDLRLRGVQLKAAVIDL